MGGGARRWRRQERAATGARAVARASARAEEAAVLGAGWGRWRRARRRRWRRRRGGGGGGGARRRGSPVMRTVPEGSKMRQSRTRWLGGRRWRLIGIVLVAVSLAAGCGVVRLRRRHAAPLRVGRRGRAGAGRRAQERRPEGDAGGPRRRGQPSRLVRRPGVRPSRPRALRGRVRRTAPARGRRRQGRPRRRAPGLPVPDPPRAGRPELALRHRGRQGGDPQPAHRAERAQHDPGLPRLRRRPARVLRARSRRRCACCSTRRSSRSSPGKRDGLYWPTNPGEPPSPLGPLVAPGAGRGLHQALGAARSPTGATTTGS